MKFIVVTNNERVRKTCEYPVAFVQGSYRDVLLYVRDRCHQGFRLLSHPLSGSVKPKENPYKSVLISDKPGAVDEDSVLLIEKAIASCDKFKAADCEKTKRYQEDFELIDSTLIESAIESAVSVCY